MPMAITAPAATIHSGSDDGRLRAREYAGNERRAVGDGRRAAKHETGHGPSTATQVRHDTAKTPSAGSPKEEYRRRHGGQKGHKHVAHYAVGAAPGVYVRRG